jgi:hypothetical protein
LFFFSFSAGVFASIPRLRRQRRSCVSIVSSEFAVVYQSACRNSVQ